LVYDETQLNLIHDPLHPVLHIRGLVIVNINDALCNGFKEQNELLHSICNRTGTKVEAIRAHLIDKPIGWMLVEVFVEKNGYPKRYAVAKAV
jgi:hypothetical protein